MKVLPWVCENNERMLFLQAEELKEKEKENRKLVNDLEEKQTKCSKLVTAFCPWLYNFHVQQSTFQNLIQLLKLYISKHKILEMIVS